MVRASDIRRSCNIPGIVKASISSVQYERCAIDPEGAALSFNSELVIALVRQNVSDIIQNKDKTKVPVDLLEPEIKPPYYEIGLKKSGCFILWEKMVRFHFTKSNSQNFLFKCSRMRILVPHYSLNAMGKERQFFRVGKSAEELSKEE